VTLESSTNASLTLHLPDGVYSYSFGSDVYGFVAPDPTGSLTVAGAPGQFPAAFTPRYAILQGTVSPASAAVSVDGNSVPVITGTYAVELAAGSYTLAVTGAGYVSNSTTVILTAGNTTTVNVALQHTPGTTVSTPSSSNGGLASMEVGALIAVVATIGIVSVLLAMAKRKKDAQQKQP